MSTWCRACGEPQATQAGPCAKCAVELAISEPADDPIGLSYEVRGKLGLGHKRGICLDLDGDSLLIHFSPKDKEPTRLPASTPPIDLVPATYSPATRLLHAADLEDAKIAWDRDLIRTRAAELCQDIRTLRRVADEALELNWPHITGWVALTRSEMAWRTAHHASVNADEDLLRESIASLPPTGYLARGELLLPHLGMIRHHAEVWRPVLAAMPPEVPLAAALLDAAVGSWEEALEGGSQFLLTAQREEWTDYRRQLSVGTSIAPPPTTTAPAWTSASLVFPVDRSRRVDDSLEQVAALEPALLDDLIDQGRLTRAAALTSVNGAARTYLLARLDPAGLTDEEVRAIGHVGELARRLFLSRDKANLSGLEDSPRVSHYQALLDVVEGARPDPSRLDAATIAVLDRPTTVLGQLKDGATRTLPPEIVADPSLWPMFADLAISGTLLPHPELASDHPVNAWIGLHRLLGLIWEGRYSEAYEHGTVLAPQLKAVEAQEDEAFNLVAFALDQVGRVDEALAMLENALKGSYTENLLVNASIVAAQARPEVGVQHLARLVDEAPTVELQRAGLDQAIGVWQRTELDFPPILVPALRTVLSASQPIEDYLRLGIVGVNVAPEVVLALPNLGGHLDGPFRLLQVRAQWKIDKDFLLPNLAEAYIGIYRSVGRADWFMDDWAGWVALNRDAIFVEFGEALGSAEFIDKVLVEAPELLTDEDRFILAPQAGAHLNVAYSKRGSYLNDRAMAKFFYHPIDDFTRRRSNFNDGFAEHVATNFTLCLGNVGLHMLGVGRDLVATDYNPLVERLRWDSQNRYAIVSQMERILSDAEQGVLSTLDTIVQRMRSLGSDEKRDLTRSLASDVAEWHDEIIRLRRNL